jgi:hypothetical protein
VSCDHYSTVVVVPVVALAVVFRVVVQDVDMLVGRRGGKEGRMKEGSTKRRVGNKQDHVVSEF